MKLETPLIAALFAGLFFIGMFTVFTGIADTNNINYNLEQYTTQDGTSSLTDSFDKIQETKDEIDQTNEEFQNTIINERDGTDLFSFFKAFFSIAKQIFGSVNIFKDIMNISIEMLGLPAEILPVFYGSIVLMLILLILYLLLGRSA